MIAHCLILQAAGGVENDMDRVTDNEIQRNVVRKSVSRTQPAVSCGVLVVSGSARWRTWVEHEGSLIVTNT